MGIIKGSVCSSWPDVREHGAKNRPFRFAARDQPSVASAVGLVFVLEAEITEGAREFGTHVAAIFAYAFTLFSHEQNGLGG